MEVTFGNMTLKLNVYNPIKHLNLEEDCFAVDVSEEQVKQESSLPKEVSNFYKIASLDNNSFTNSRCDDSLETYLSHCGDNFGLDESIEQIRSLVDSAPWSRIEEWISMRSHFDLLHYLHS